MEQRSRSAGAAPVLRTAPGLERDLPSGQSRNLQDIPDGRGMALHEERDHPELCCSGAEGPRMRNARTRMDCETANVCLVDDCVGSGMLRRRIRLPVEIVLGENAFRCCGG